MNEQQDPRRGGTSASSAPYDDLCPGRHLAQKGIPDSESDDARFGRRVHAALAKRDPSTLTTDQVDIYESCVAIEEKVVEKFFGPDRANAKTFIEQRFWVKVKARIPNPGYEGGPGAEVQHKDVYYDHSGQPDKIYRIGPRALIIEYKTLPGEVAASPENQQLRDQVVLAARSLVVPEVMVVVIQPLVTHDPIPCLYDEVSIKQAEEEMFGRVRRSNDPESPRIAGEEQCKFCRAKPYCKEHAKWSGALLPERIALPDLPVSEWTQDQRVAFCAGYSAVEKWIEENKEAMKVLMATDPDAVPGYHLKPGKVKNVVNDPQELFSRFITLGGTSEQFMDCISIGKEKFVEQVRAVTGKNGKHLAVETGKLMAGIVTEKQDAPSIAKKNRTGR